jgi:hypothetical protein
MLTSVKSLRRCSFVAFLAAVGCTASGPADEAQLAVAKAIDNVASSVTDRFAQSPAVTMTI